MSSNVLAEKTIVIEQLASQAFAAPQQLNLQVEQLYSEHHSWLSKWLYTKLGCNQQAADLSHDTFVRILRKTYQLDLIKPRAYLTTIAHSLVVNHWRRCDIEKAYLAALTSLGESYAPSAEDCLVVIETLTKIDAVLTGLPSAVRQAFLLSQLDGLTYKVIGQKLSVSERTIKKYMAKAMLHCLTAAK